MEVIDFVQNNWVEIAAALALFREFAIAVSKLTPWTWDDSLVAILAKLLPTKK